MVDNPITSRHINTALMYTRFSRKKRSIGMFIGITIMVKLINNITWIDAINLMVTLANPHFSHLIPKEWKNE